MPLRIPSDLPASTILTREKVFVMDVTRAEKRDIRELKIIILNLMPKKIETETQLLRLLSNTPLQIDIDFLTTETYKPKNISEQHLFKFYKTFKDVEHLKYDGMIITGAPLEHIKFKEVAYWDEIIKIFNWASNNVTSTMFICWAAQAALFYYYGIESSKESEKFSGVYEHEIENLESPILRGFDDKFFVPVSRYVRIKRENVLKTNSLQILSESNKTGVYLITSTDKKHLFVANHPEYEKNTLKQEYFRDLDAGISPEIPQNYFYKNDSKLDPVVKWRSHANLLFSNWINYYVYQETDFDLFKGENADIAERNNIINVIVFGTGNVGSAFINLILKKQDEILKKQNIDIRLVSISNSRNIIMNPPGIKENWENLISESKKTDNLSILFNFVKKNKLNNLIFIDATSDTFISENYPEIIKNGHNIVAANKIANCFSYKIYKNFREKLNKYKKYFFYETNVGAGLPLIDTIKYLYKTGDKVKKVRGIFSGSLSYIFNTFSISNKNITSILEHVVKSGLAEPDPREDLSGKDVARKLLIVAREIGWKSELDDIQIQSLLPEELKNCPKEDFWKKISILEDFFNNLKKSLKDNEVLRYIGELNNNILNVRLVTVNNQSNLGRIKNTDSIFEIYTERYSSTPLVIQGAGAGPEVTANGLLSDLLKIAQIIGH